MHQPAQGGQALRAAHQENDAGLGAPGRPHRRRGGAGWAVHHSHRAEDRADGQRELRAQPQVAGATGAGVPLDQDDGSEGAAASASAGESGAGPHLPVHAGLQGGVAYARGLGAADAHRYRARGQGRDASRARRRAGAQLAHAAAGTLDPGAQHLPHARRRPRRTELCSSDDGPSDPAKGPRLDPSDSPADRPKPADHR